MRPWRDIVSTGAWEQIVRKTDSTAHISKMTSVKAVFDSKVDTPKRSLERITALIRQYHQIPKTDYNQLGMRIGGLAWIRDAAEEHLRKFRVDMDKAKLRTKQVGVYSMETQKTAWSAKPLEKSPHTGRYEAGNAVDQSLDRNILTLQNRSFRKAEYLSRLRDYYGNNSRNPQDLINALAKPQERGADFTGLSPGVRMEAIDPWHRPVEVSFDQGKLKESDELQDEYSSSMAFAQWYHGIGTQHNLPFFLWLEGHPICLADDKALVAGTAAVTYVDNANGYGSVPVQYRIAMVYPHGGKLWMDELKPNGYTRVADTAGYVCSSGKGVSDAAAFIWTGREIIIAQHQESGFHHSSFNGGGAVRMAGMIKINAGQIVYISNNSGHYKPSKSLLEQFVREMGRRGLLAQSCEVQCQGVTPQYRNSAQHFLAHWAAL